MTTDTVVNPATGEVFRATDPVVSNVATPADFAAQFATPLDTTELIAMCEEINAWKNIPAQRTNLKTYVWRELSSLGMTSGTSYLAFADGTCPEEYTHNGANKTVDLKFIGVKKSLTESDILHSIGSIQAGYGIRQLIGGGAGSSGMPGGGDFGSLIRANITDLKSKEVVLGSTLVLNGWDNMLINGNATTNPLEFDGLVNLVTEANGAHVNAGTTGTFSAAAFDRFLAEACAKPTHIFGHPAAIQEMMAGYFQLGFAGSQVVNFTSGNRITPGYNFGGTINTGIGTLQVVADTNFPRTDMGGGNFQSSLYALRMTHNGEPLVYRIDQIGLQYRDLAPGCTAISFEIITKTALVVKMLCSQSVYSAGFQGRLTTSCTEIF
jgi:hypothetical protein